MFGLWALGFGLGVLGFGLWGWGLGFGFGLYRRQMRRALAGCDCLKEATELKQKGFRLINEGVNANVARDWIIECGMKGV